MIGWALLLIASVAGMFVIILRRLPRALETYREHEQLGQTANLPRIIDPPAAKAPKVTASIAGPPALHIKEPVMPEEPTTTEPIKDGPLTEAAAEEALRAKDYPTAAQIYEGLLKDDTGNAKYYSRLGLIYLESERFHDARDIFRTALKFGDQVASRHANLAMAEYALGHRLTAIRYLKRAVALAPQTKRYHELLETFENESR